MEAAVWFCGAPADPVSDGLARRVAGLGLEVTGAPSTAERAVIILSPELAAADPPDLRQWVAERGMDELVLCVAGGGAAWDEDAGRFVSGEGGDAVPASLREAVGQRPLVIDVREADAAKLDRCAHRIAGAVSAGGPPPFDHDDDQDDEPVVAGGVRRRVPLAVAAVLLGAMLLGTLVYALAGGSDSGSGTSAATSVRPSTTTPGRISTTVTLVNPATTTTTGLPGTSTSVGPSTTGLPGTSTSVGPSTTGLPPSTDVVVPASGEVASDDSTGVVAWVVILILAGALAVTLVLLLKRRRAAPTVPPGIAPAVAGAPQVFISHDTEADGRVARKLVDQLRRRQLEAWIAPDSIPPGEPWVFAIEQGLVTSRAALVLVSPAALASGWVRREIQMIVDLEIDGRLLVVPVRVAPSEVPLLLTAYQWVDVGDFDRAADSLARRFAAPTATGSTAGGRR